MFSTLHTLLFGTSPIKQFLLLLSNGKKVRTEKNVVVTTKVLVKFTLNQTKIILSFRNSKRKAATTGLAETNKYIFICKVHKWYIFNLLYIGRTKSNHKQEKKRPPKTHGLHFL